MLRALGLQVHGDGLAGGCGQRQHVFTQALGMTQCDRACLPATFHVRRPFRDRDLDQFRGVISDYASAPAAPLPSHCASAAEGRNQHRLFMSRLSQAARGVKPIHPRHAEVKERSVSMKSETAAPAALCLVHGGVRSMPRSGYSDYGTDFVACVLCKVMFHLPESRRGQSDPQARRSDRRQGAQEAGKTALTSR